MRHETCILIMDPADKTTLQAHFIAILVIFVLSLCYYLVGIVWFLCKWSLPGIRARLPWLTLANAAGLLLRDVAIASIIFLYEAMQSPEAVFIPHCYLGLAASMLYEISATWALLFRLRYIHHVSRVRSAFS